MPNFQNVKGWSGWPQRRQLHEPYGVTWTPRQLDKMRAMDKTFAARMFLAMCRYTKQRIVIVNDDVWHGINQLIVDDYNFKWKE